MPVLRPRYSDKPLILRTQGKRYEEVFPWGLNDSKQKSFMSSSRKSDELSVDLVDNECHSMTLKMYGNLFTLFLSFRLI